MELTTIRVSVTQEDIDKGKQGDCSFCPIALALKRAGVDGPIVGCMIVGAIGSSLSANLPTEAADFVQAFDFDFGGAAQPFEFDMAVPQSWLRA